MHTSPLYAFIRSMINCDDVSPTFGSNIITFMDHKHQLHILVGCADARDLSQLQLDIINSKIRDYAIQGIKIQMQVIRAAGSFISTDVYQDIKNIIIQYQKEIPADFAEEGYYVHIQSHGHLTEDSNTDYISHIYEMHIKDESPLNCGMLGASSVGIEIEQLILKNSLSYKTPSGDITVKNDEGLRQLLRDVYAYDGFLAGDWIKSIDLLRTHPRSQKSNLEKMISNDPELKRLDIKITAGIQDYSIHGLIRLDGGVPASHFWDDVQQEIRNSAKNRLDELKAQSESQKPMAGLICMADPRMTSRITASKYYYHYKGLPEPSGYLANTLFNLTGSTFDIPSIPFGPYAITGFYYAVKHLGLTDQMVMGADETQTNRIMHKIHSDPIMNLIVESFGVHLIPINQRELV